MVPLVIATRNAHKVAEIRAILGDRFHYQTLKDFPGAPKTVEDAETFQGNAAKKAIELARWLAQTQNPKPETLEGFVLADDSGLEVDALDGAPGVNSARFAGLDMGTSGNTSDADNNAKLLRLLRDVPPEKRTARFRCVVAFVPFCLPPFAHELGRAELSTLRSSSATEDGLLGLDAQCTPKAFGAGRVPTGFKAARRDSSPEESILHPRFFEGACEGRIGDAPRGQGGFGYDPLFIPNGFNQTFAELGEETKNRLSHRARALAALKAGA